MSFCRTAALLLTALALPSAAQNAPAVGSEPQSPASQPTSAQSPDRNAVEPANDASGVYTITRNARIVILDMVVADAKGNVATDLKKDDFHITESDEPQTILNFEAADAHTLPSQITTIAIPYRISLDCALRASLRMTRPGSAGENRPLLQVRTRSLEAGSRERSISTP